MKLNNFVWLAEELNAAGPRAEYRDELFFFKALDMASKFTVEKVVSESRNKFCVLWGQLLDWALADLYQMRTLLRVSPPLAPFTTLNTLRRGTNHSSIHSGLHPLRYPQCTSHLSSIPIRTRGRRANVVLSTREAAVGVNMSPTTGYQLVPNPHMPREHSLVLMNRFS